MTINKTKDTIDVEDIKKSEATLYKEMDSRTFNMNLAQKSNQHLKIYATSSMTMLKMLRDDAAKRSIPQLLNNERIILAHSLDHATNLQQKNSFTVALAGLEECQTSFASLSNDPESYKKAVPKSYGAKTIQNDLPLDVARQFFKSHYARLDNYLKSPTVDHTEGLLLVQRKNNIKILEQCYIELQQKSLDITPPSKNKGVSR